MNINEAKSYKAIILLNELITNKRIFRTILNGDDKLLEPLFIDLLSKGYVSIVNDRYDVTQEGKNVFDTFMKKYPEYNKIFDVFAFVDTNKGEFAFEKYYDFDTDEAWDSYKEQERFFDFRIAVATFKKLNPSELVFMDFINKGRFDTSVTGWQMDLLSDEIWSEVDTIVREAIVVDDKEALEEIIKRGAEVAINALKKELEINKSKLEEAKSQMAVSNDYVYEDDNYIIETTTIIEDCEYDIDYYNSYYDPFYCSPIWFSPLFIW